MSERDHSVVGQCEHREEERLRCMIHERKRDSDCTPDEPDSVERVSAANDNGNNGQIITVGPCHAVVNDDKRDGGDGTERVSEAQHATHASDPPVCCQGSSG
jgi:hypothetical protein